MTWEDWPKHETITVTDEELGQLEQLAVEAAEKGLKISDASLVMQGMRYAAATQQWLMNKQGEGYTFVLRRSAPGLLGYLGFSVDEEVRFPNVTPDPLPEDPEEGYAFL